MMRCEEVERFVHAYVDGEFEDEERVPLERHLAGCPGCRERVSFETLFKTHLRARLRRPDAPAGLKSGVLRALDRADAAGEGPRRSLWRGAVSGVALAGAAALVLIGVLSPAKASLPILEEAARAHEKNLPVEVGGTEENVRSWMVGKASIPVRVLRIRDGTFVGGRLWHVAARDAAQLTYRVGGLRSTTTMSVMQFDPAGWDIDDGDLRTGQVRGYNVVLTRNRGVGFAFASDLDRDEMIRLVSASLRE